MSQQVLNDQSSNVSTNPQRRTGYEVKSCLLTYRKTGTGTCTLTVRDERSDAALPNGSVDVVATDGVSGAIEFPASQSVYVEMSNVAGSVAVDAWIDGLPA